MEVLVYIAAFAPDKGESVNTPITLTGAFYILLPQLADVDDSTPVLADDGHDLAAALATIEEMGRGADLHDAIGQAFPGNQLQVTGERGQFTLGVAVPGIRRAMTGFELSDGTLRFLCLAAALLSPRPPELLVLNERKPASTLRFSQLWVTSSRSLPNRRRSSSPPTPSTSPITSPE